HRAPRLFHNSIAFAGSCWWPKEEPAAVFESHFSRVSQSRTISCPPRKDCNGISDLERHILLESGPGQHIGRKTFKFPVGRLSVRFFDVHIEMAVRIGPLDLCDNT